MKFGLVHWAPLALAFGVAGQAAAQEFSVIETSSVIGKNFDNPNNRETGPVTPVGEVDLAVETTVFAKNLEYIDLGALDGETFFGAIVPVRALYRPNEKLTVELGAVLGQNFGDDDSLDAAEPLIRIAYAPADSVTIVAGTLFATHPMHESLLDDVQKFRDLTEQGLQVRVNGKTLKQDTWINWRIREGKVDAEEFEVGHVSRLSVLDDLVRLDAQALWSHAGGQISTSTRVDNNLTTLLGASVGVREPAGLKRLSSVRVGVNALYASDNDRGSPHVEGDGVEFYGQIDISVRDDILLRTTARSYSGDPLLSERGDPLYGFDKYTQVGANLVWSLNDSLAIEVGGAAQRTASKTNWSAMINLSWQGRFDLGFIRPR